MQKARDNRADPLLLLLVLFVVIMVGLLATAARATGQRYPESVRTYTSGVFEDPTYYANAALDTDAATAVAELGNGNGFKFRMRSVNIDADASNTGDVCFWFSEATCTGTPGCDGSAGKLLEPGRSVSRIVGGNLNVCVAASTTSQTVRADVTEVH